MNPETEARILQSLRRVTRALDLHSRQLATSFGLTSPQLACLRVLASAALTPGELARKVSLSQPTVTGIVDRLVLRRLVRRRRSQRDRRQVTLQLTPEGAALVDRAPSPLDAAFAARLDELADAERERISETLEQVAEMMDGGGAAPTAALSTLPPAVLAEELEVGAL